MILYWGFAKKLPFDVVSVGKFLLYVNINILDWYNMVLSAMSKESNFPLQYLELSGVFLGRYLV
jgi:hypothetical protein